LNNLQRFALLLSFASAPSFAAVDLEVSGASSTQIIEDKERNREDKVKSNDVGIYIGYRLGSTWSMSLGLLVNQKNYDYSSLVKNSFNDGESDEETFSLPLSNIESSSKGLLFGPQITVGYGWKYFEPYLRAAYLTGTMKLNSNMDIRGDIEGTTVAGSIETTTDQKVSFTQVGLGFRIPFSISYFFLEYMYEKSAATYEDGYATFSTTEPEVASESLKIDGGETDESSGSVVKLGFGFRL
jgi:hypothetical protein